jgi:hypothetical protein
MYNKTAAYSGVNGDKMLKSPRQAVCLRLLSYL